MSVLALGILKLRDAGGSFVGQPLLFHRFAAAAGSQAGLRDGIGQEELAKCIVRALGLSWPAEGFVPERDSCRRAATKPLFSLPLPGGVLRPLLVTELSGGCLMWCLGNEDHEDSIVDAFALLEAAGEFLGQLPANVSPEEPKLMELLLFLSYACPFGTPVSLELPLYRHLFTSAPTVPVDKEAGDGASTTWSVGAPADKKSKSVPLALQLTERIFYSCQDENACHSRHGDNFMCFGSLTCDASTLKEKCSLEVRLSSQRNQLRGVLVSPRCSYWDATTGQSVLLRLQPPRQSATRLVAYWLGPGQQPIQPVLTGFYQVRLQSRRASLRLQLSFSELLCRAKCDFCEVQLQLPAGSPQLKDAKVTCSTGTAVLSPGRQLVWKLTAPPARLQAGVPVSLTGTVGFANSDDRSEAANALGAGAAASDSTCCARVYFRFSRATLSGAKLESQFIANATGRSSDSPKVTMPPPPVVSMSVESGDCAIWNSFGDAPTAYRPEDQLLTAAEMAILE